MRTHRVVVGLVGFAFTLIVAGCGGGSSARSGTSPTEAPTKGGPGESPLPPELAKGRAVFEKLNCGNCHMIHGTAIKGKKGFGGPDLGTVGADRTHTAAWISDHIKDPTVHKANSKMPKYEGKISDEDLKDLAKYLESLK